MAMPIPERDFRLMRFTARITLNGKKLREGFGSQNEAAAFEQGALVAARVAEVELETGGKYVKTGGKPLRHGVRIGGRATQPELRFESQFEARAAAYGAVRVLEALDDDTEVSLVRKHRVVEVM